MNQNRYMLVMVARCREGHGGGAQEAMGVQNKSSSSIVQNPCLYIVTSLWFRKSNGMGLKTL